MAYSSIPDSQIDADSPLIADTFFKLRDNPIAIANGDSGAPRIQSSAFATGAVNAAALGAAAVGQAALKTTTGTVGTGTIYSGGNADLTIPGGMFYLGLEFYGPSDGGGSWTVGGGATIAVEDAYTPVRCRVSKTAGSGGYAGTLRSTYIQSSPPYDLGNGLAHDFVFIRLSSTGEIKGTFCAPDAPWHFCGPNSIRPDRTDKQGRTYKKVPQDVAEHLQGRRPMLSAFERLKLAGFRRSEIQTVEIEMTAEYKDLDIDLIPHPFGKLSPGDVVLLIDPASALALDLQEIREIGEDPTQIIMREYIDFNNHSLVRGCRQPKGVQVVRSSWKNSRRFS